MDVCIPKRFIEIQKAETSWAPRVLHSDCVESDALPRIRLESVEDLHYLINFGPSSLECTNTQDVTVLISRSTSVHNACALLRMRHQCSSMFIELRD